VSDTIALDTSAPSGSISINGGASTTASLNVTLSLSASGATEMRIGNSSDFSSVNWESYTPSKSWTLTSGDGTKMVYVQFRDSAGNESSVVSESIVVDTQAPSGSISINGGASHTSDSSVTLNLSASGAAEMRISNSSDLSGSSWETYSSTRSWTLSSGDGAKTVYAQFRDAAANESDTVSDTIVLATSAHVSDDMVLIPAGEFSMGDAFNEGESDELPVHTVYLDAFYMDKYEVTNAQYAAFLNQYDKNTDASGNELLNFDSSYCRIEEVDGSFRAESGYENDPVVEVNWYGAVAYAEFYGKRLPTEAEWEKAARGGLVGKRYPWGDSISHDDANYKGTGGRDVWDGTSPVGSFAPNGYGLYDMAGNVWEWCADRYDSSYYASSSRSNPQGPTSGIWRVLRGGSWANSSNHLRCANRNYDSPAVTDVTVGFRCSK
jgi:formylglycine-generating enzyme required for sulfatase activity